MHADEEVAQKEQEIQTWLSSLRLYLTLADFDEYLTNSHTFNK